MYYREAGATFDLCQRQYAHFQPQNIALLRARADITPIRLRPEIEDLKILTSVGRMKGEM